MTPEEAAQALRRAADDLGESGDLIQNVLFVAQRNSQKHTPVLTGHLRRSETTRVLSARKGVLGSNLAYARHRHEGTKYMKGVPFFVLGLNASRARIDQLLQQYGDQALGKVGS